MNVAIVYDRVNKWGGAERTLLALNEIFPKAPLYTAVYSPKGAGWASVFPEVIPSFLQKVPILRSYHELLGTFTPIAFETLSFSGEGFDKYDLVISVTSEAAKGIITKSHTKHICYCLTPTRYLWSGHEEYAINPPKKLRMIPFYSQISRPILWYVRKWDKIAAQRPDVMVAISTEVRKRIKKYYNRDSDIVFPPVDVDKFSNAASLKNLKKPAASEDYYFIAGRFEPYKKVDVAIEAFNKLGKKLVVAGTGGDEKKLKKIAGPNIEFVGHVTDGELVSYYSGAKGFIFPQDEDFGITAVEAQAAGTPVIAFRAGGALDTVIDGKTGIFFEKQEPDELAKAVNRFEKIKFDKGIMFENAEKYSKEKFKSNIKKLVKKYLGG